MAYRRALETRRLCCSNCGVEGHLFRECEKPIMSYGILAIQRMDTSANLCTTSPILTGYDLIRPLQILLICRRDSLSFIEFIRGKYSTTDLNYLYTLLQNMTKREHEKIRYMTFDELWRSVWGSAADTHKNDYETSERRYRSLGDISELLDAHPTIWLEPEWGFPKGRRNSGETEVAGALREFEEETNINRMSLSLFQNVHPFVETFVGSNQVQYCHKYFLAMCRQTDLSLSHENPHMSREIGAIGWFTIEQALEKIRPASKEKLGVLVKLDAIMRTFCPIEI